MRTKHDAETSLSGATARFVLRNANVNLRECIERHHRNLLQQVSFECRGDTRPAHQLSLPPHLAEQHLRLMNMINVSATRIRNRTHRLRMQQTVRTQN